MSVSVYARDFAATATASGFLPELKLILSSTCKYQETTLACAVCALVLIVFRCEQGRKWWRRQPTVDQNEWIRMTVRYSSLVSFEPAREVCESMKSVGDDLYESEVS